MKKIIIVIFLGFFICIPSIHTAKSQELKNETNFKKHLSIPGYGVKKMKNPSIFQGNKKRKQYFEGGISKWYLQMRDAILSVIPGISLSQNGEEQHAFIQIIDGKTAETFYYTYPIEEFGFSTKTFGVRIGDNYFSEDRVILNIQNDSTSIKGEVYMSDQVHLSKNNKKKVGIMGWYRFVPFMECYHGVVSLNHQLNGSIIKDNKTYNFNSGLGYIEKDWGKSMPSDWIWIQSNHFNASNTSFMLSVATIPWIGSSFTGFLGFFLHNNKIQRFGTYTHAKLQVKKSDAKTVEITLTDKKYTYYIKASHNKSGVLKAPVKGLMDRRISESIDAQLSLKVIDKKGNVFFNDNTSIAGLETVGNIKL